MTEGQLRYRSLMEDQRHNLAMERIGHTQAEASKQTAEVREAEQRLKELQWPVYEKQIKQSMRAQAITTAISGAHEFVKALGDTYGMVGQIIKLAGS